MPEVKGACFPLIVIFLFNSSNFKPLHILVHSIILCLLLNSKSELCATDLSHIHVPESNRFILGTFVTPNFPLLLRFLNLNDLCE